MKRTATAAMTMALTAGFLVGDVVSLPTSSSVAPVIERVGLAAGGRVLSASAAGVRPFFDAAVPAPDGEQVFESAEISTQEFTVAGVSWDSGTLEDPSDVQVRVREAGGWTGWQTLALNDEGPDAGTAEYEAASAVTATDPLVSPGADAVQVRLSLAGDEVPAGLEVVVIDPGEQASDDTLTELTPLATAGAAVSRPTIISRAAWGADESLRDCTPSYASSLKAATVHHTAGSNAYTSGEAAGVVRGIYAYHTRTLGWCDIGYNFLVDKFGRVYEGRAGGVDKAVVGAHAGGFNNGTVGISAIGNYSEASAPAVMVGAIGAVAGWKLTTAGVDPGSSVSLRSSGGGTSKYSSGTTVTVPAVFGHRDVGSTACPGTNLYAQLGAVRTRARAALGDAAFVNALYVDMLSRVPAQAEIDHWVPFVAAPGGRWATASLFAQSQEYRKKSITAAYVDILGRQPDAGGLQGWYLNMVAGGPGVDDIRRIFLASEEFRVQGGGTDEGWIKLLYRRALGREASPAEVQHWLPRIKTMGREGVIGATYDSAESAKIRVDRSYQAWHQREAGDAERVHWQAFVIAYGDEAMRQAVMVSEEYYVRAQRR